MSAVENECAVEPSSESVNRFNQESKTGSGVSPYVYSVEGMHCIKCIRKIQSVANEFDEIQNIKVDLGSKSLTAYARADFDTLRFEKEIYDQGFNLKKVSFEDQEESRNLNALARKQLYRLGVAGFFAGNIMLFSAAEYVGAGQESWSILFPILSAIFFIPVLFYSAQPFFKNSYLSFKAKKISIDTPIALAILGGAVLSYIQLVLGHRDIYFDSISMFIFLLLFSRYLIFKIQNKYLAPIKLEDVCAEKFVEVKKDETFILTPIEQVQIGDLIEVKKNKYIPLDCELISAEGLISDAFYSGEVFPKRIKNLELVFAGSKNLAGDIQLRVKKNFENTRLTEIVNKLNMSLGMKTDISTLADKGAHYFTLLVLVSALLVFGYFSFFNVVEGLNRALALLVVACPCGLAIVVPLIQTLAIKFGIKESLLIKKPSVLEVLPDIKVAFLDKTGTLTKGEIKVKEVSPREPSLLEKEIIYNLEKNSEHPIALALIQWTGIQKNLVIDNFDEKIGLGVSGYYNNDFYEIKGCASEVHLTDKKGCAQLVPQQSGPEGSEAHDGEEKASVFLFKNGIEILNFNLDDTVGEGASDFIKYLDTKKIQPFILSGDRRPIALKMAKNFSIPESNVFAPLSPEEKLNLVRKKTQTSIYVGDGINDSMAMSHSDISISMQSSANLAFKSSDVHILSGGLSKLIDLFELSDRYISTIKKVISVSFVYNIIFAIFASLGLINPLIAVIIMPTSSLTVTFLALFFMKKGVPAKRT